MPYIDRERRGLIDQGFADPKNPGELNYAVTKLLITYLTDQGLNYQHINDVIGALEGAKFEVYRRLAAPYENQKLAINGDVYEEMI